MKSLADGNDWYWKHLGAMDNYKYRNDNYLRLKDLNDIGIIQWKNIIITTETEDNPLDVRWVDEIIKYYLL